MTFRLLPALALALLLPCHPLLAQDPSPAAPEGPSPADLPRAPHVIAANDRDAPLDLDAGRSYPAELLLLGFDLRFADEAQRDLWALAAGEFALDGGTSHGDLRAAAKAVKLNRATVRGNLLAVANGVQIDSSRVLGETLLRANRVYTGSDASFDGDVLLYAPEIRLGGTFSGNVSCPAASTLQILPGTRVLGTLSYPDSLSPAVPSDASIAARSPLPAPPPPTVADLVRRRLRFAAAFWISSILLGIPMFRFFPLRTSAALQLLRRRPLACAVTGLCTSSFAFLPLAILALTGYAFPLAFCAGLLLLCFAVASIPLMGLPLGQFLLGRRRPSAGPVPPSFSALAAGLLALALPPALLGLPGVLFLFAAATLPFGAFVMTVFHPVIVLRTPPPPPPPPSA